MLVRRAVRPRAAGAAPALCRAGRRARLRRGPAPARISGQERASAPEPREQACLRLAAADKSDWEIGRILGIAEETACQYLKRARAAYDVPTRTQLVVHGLRDGWIGYGDAIPPIGGMG